jgi:hypothetical protein
MPWSRRRALSGCAICGGLGDEPYSSGNAAVRMIQGWINITRARAHALRTAVSPEDFADARHRLNVSLETYDWTYRRGRPSGVSLALWAEFADTLQRARYTLEHQRIPGSEDPETAPGEPSAPGEAPGTPIPSGEKDPWSGERPGGGTNWLLIGGAGVAAAVELILLTSKGGQ